MKKAPREYDIQRKEETVRKLLEGFDELKELHPGKEITIYALSKYTGVARQTIAKNKQVMELLDTQKTFKGAKGIKTRQDVKKLVDKTEKQLKEKDKKYEDLMRENTALNLKIVQLTDEINRLSVIIDRYERVNRNESE